MQRWVKVRHTSTCCAGYKRKQHPSVFLDRSQVVFLGGGGGGGGIVDLVSTLRMREKI